MKYKPNHDKQLDKKLERSEHREEVENLNWNVEQAHTKIPKKTNGQVTVLIFRSGSVSITGAKNTIELYEAYREIVKVVEENRKEIFVSQALVLV